MNQIEPDTLYTRAALARVLGVRYHTLYSAEHRGEIPRPGFPMWRRTYYSQAELAAVVAWAEAKRRVRA